MAPKQKGLSAKEKKRLQKLQEAKIKESKAQVEEGMKLLEKNWQKAIASFTSAIETNPENIEAHLQRAYCYKNIKEYDKAIQDYTKALDLDLTDPAGYSGRGNAYECIEDYDKAIADYTEVIELCPDDDHAYNMRGSSRQAKRISGLKLKNAEFASVISDFTKAIEINPYNYFAYNNRGNAYFDRKDFQSAIEDYTQAIEIKVDYAYAYLRRGIAAYEYVIYDERQAKVTAEEVQEKENSNGTLPKLVKSIDDSKAVWEAEFKEMEEKEKKEKEKEILLNHAAADLTTVLTFNEDIQALTYRAKVYNMLGKADLARLDDNKKMEIDIRNVKK